MQQVSPRQPLPRIPHTVQKRAEAHGLYTLQATYACMRQSWLDRVLGPFAILIGIGIIGYFYYAYNGVFILESLSQAALIPLVGLVWIVVGTWIALASQAARRMRVFVYDEGILLLNYGLAVIRWEEITALWKSVRVNKKAGIVRSYMLLRNDQRMFRFTDDIVEIEKLGTTLETKVTAQYLPRVLATFGNGASVIFGSIALNTQGIKLNNERMTISWNELERVTLDEMMLTLYKKGDSWAWAMLPCVDIPNLGVLQALIEYAQEKQAAHAQLTSRSLDSPHLAQALALYQAGYSVTFGAISISQQGVSLQENKTLLAWHEIASIGVGAREVIICRTGEIADWYVIPLALIDDVPTLRALLQQLAQ